jgi:hypothetical protein
MREITVSQFQEEMQDIEYLRNYASKITYSKNPFIRWFQIRKHYFLMELANEGMEELFHQTNIIVDQDFLENS